jgi:hypothetical protein
MDTAHTLYENFKGSDNPKLIVNSAIEIQKHFSNILEKEPTDEIGEELLYLLGGKKEKIDWIALVLILDSNDEMLDNYLSVIIKKNYKVDIKQSQWLKALLEEIKLRKSDNYAELFNYAIKRITSSIDKKRSAQKKISNDKFEITKQKAYNKKNFWDKLFKHNNPFQISKTKNQSTLSKKTNQGNLKEAKKTSKYYLLFGILFLLISFFILIHFYKKVENILTLISYFSLIFFIGINFLINFLAIREGFRHSPIKEYSDKYTSISLGCYTHFSDYKVNAIGDQRWKDNYILVKFYFNLPKFTANLESVTCPFCGSNVVILVYSRLLSSIRFLLFLIFILALIQPSITIHPVMGIPGLFMLDKIIYKNERRFKLFVEDDHQHKLFK